MKYFRIINASIRYLIISDFDFAAFGYGTTSEVVYDLRFFLESRFITEEYYVLLSCLCPPQQHKLPFSQSKNQTTAELTKKKKKERKEGRKKERRKNERKKERTEQQSWLLMVYPWSSMGDP